MSKQPFFPGDIVTCDYPWPKGEQHIRRRVTRCWRDVDMNSWWGVETDGGEGGTPLRDLDSGKFQLVARGGNFIVRTFRYVRDMLGSQSGWRWFVFTRKPWGWDFRLPVGWLCWDAGRRPQDEWGQRLYWTPDCTPVHPRAVRFWYRPTAGEAA